MNILRIQAAALAVILTLILNPAMADVGVRSRAFQEYASNIERLRVRAFAGDAQAQYELAMELGRSGVIGGIDTKPNYAQAREFAEKSALQGNLNGQNFFGVLLTRGLGGAADPKSGFQWFKKAAEAGHAEAQANLASTYIMGSGTPIDPSATFHWYRKSAAQGSTDGQYGLATAYATGTGTTRDLVAAFQWYERAGRQKHPEAAHEVGMAYAKGAGVQRNPGQAVFWLAVATRFGSQSSEKELPAVLAELSRVKTWQAAQLMSSIEDTASVTAIIEPGTPLFVILSDAQWTFVYRPQGNQVGFIRSGQLKPWAG